MRILLAAILASFTALTGAELRVVCSVPELGDLVRRVGGDLVAVDVIARPSDNPHFITARPSHIRKLASADVFVVIGMDLEVGWAPALVRSARNNRVRPGQPGFVDCSRAIQPLEVPTGDLDRSLGDVHPHGNPHYLLSPLNGMLVVDYLATRLAAIAPAHAEAFADNAAAINQALAVALYGETAVDAHGVASLRAWHAAGSLRQQVAEGSLGGWIHAMEAVRGTNWFGDHRQWAYLADCYGFQMVGHLEPKAGVPPTSSHIQSLVARARSESISGVITAPWFDQRSVQTLSRAATLPVATVAHQVGATPSTETYTAFCAQPVGVMAGMMSASAPTP